MAAKPADIARFARPAARSAAFAPGRETAGDEDHSTSVNHSVARSQASAHQSSGRSRRAATRWAAANVSQIGPQRRNSSRASSDGRSCPSTRSVASGAAIVAVPRSRSKATMPRFARRMTSSPGIAGAQRTLPKPMAKQRQIKIEQRSALAAMQQLETRSDEELEGEQKYRAAAQAILGARAAEKYDAAKSREHFRKAISAARPQERMQLRRMADASLALAERRPDDLKEAVTRLGQAPPTSRQLLMLRLMGLVAPPQNAPWYMKVRGILLIMLVVIVLLAVGFGIVKLISLPFGGTGTGVSLLLGLLLVVAVLGVMVLVGRRRQAKARDAARAQQRMS